MNTFLIGVLISFSKLFYKSLNYLQLKRKHVIRTQNEFFKNKKYNFSLFNHFIRFTVDTLCFIVIENDITLCNQIGIILNKIQSFIKLSISFFLFERVFFCVIVGYILNVANIKIRMDNKYLICCNFISKNNNYLKYFVIKSN